MTVDLPGSKEEMRRQLVARRAALAEAHRTAASARAVAHLAAWLDLPKGALVSLFAAFGDEADPTALEPQLRAAEARAVYPRVVRPPAGDPRLPWLQLKLAWRAELVPEPRWKIPEPTASHREVSPAEVNVFVVPGLGFTRAGARIGYGRGFYDRTLRAARAGNPAVVTVGFGFAAQLVEAIPVGPQDEALDFIVTEDGLFAAVLDDAS